MLAGGACCPTAVGPVNPARARSPEVLRHLDAAGAAAGDDLLSYLQLADPLMTGYKSAPFDLAKAMQLPAAAPAKAFDNLFFLGSGWVSPWAIRTNDGIVLIDEEGERIIAGGMRRLGARPGATRTLGHGSKADATRGF